MGEPTDDDPVDAAVKRVGAEDLDDLERLIEDRLPMADPVTFTWELEDDHQLVAVITGGWPGQLRFDVPQTKAEFDPAVAVLDQQLAWRESIERELPAFDPDDAEPDDAVPSLGSFLGLDQSAVKDAIGPGWFPVEAEPWDATGDQLLRTFSGPGPAGPLLLGITDDIVGLCVNRGEEWLAWDLEIPHSSADLLGTLREGVARLRPVRKRIPPRPRSVP